MGRGLKIKQESDRKTEIAADWTERYSFLPQPIPYQSPRDSKKHLEDVRRGGERIGKALGEGIPKIDLAELDIRAKKEGYVYSREEKWAYNLKKLESMIPGLFSTEFFSKITPILGGRSEGIVREYAFDKDAPFISFSGEVWRKVAIKKFNKGARSNPEEQAETLHSLNLIKQFWSEPERRKWPSKLFIAEAIAYKGPYLVMRSLTGEHHVRADNLPDDLKKEVMGALRQAGRLIAAPEQRLVNAFKEAGMRRYPSPDFIPSNVIAHLDDRMGTMDRIWVFDQFSVPPGRAGEKALQKGSLRRLYDTERWGLKRS